MKKRKYRIVYMDSHTRQFAITGILYGDAVHQQQQRELIAAMHDSLIGNVRVVPASGGPIWSYLIQND